MISASSADKSNEPLNLELVIVDKVASGADGNALVQCVEKYMNEIQAMDACENIHC